MSIGVISKLMEYGDGKGELILHYPQGTLTIPHVVHASAIPDGNTLFINQGGKHQFNIELKPLSWFTMINR